MYAAPRVWILHWVTVLIYSKSCGSAGIFNRKTVFITGQLEERKPYFSQPSPRAMALHSRGPSALTASWFICISTARWIRNYLHAVPSVSNEDAFSQTPMRTARMRKALCTPGNILSVTHHIVMQCAHSMWRFNGVVILL